MRPPIRNARATDFSAWISPDRCASFTVMLALTETTRTGRPALGGDNSLWPHAASARRIAPVLASRNRRDTTNGILRPVTSIMIGVLPRPLGWHLPFPKRANVHRIR
jgi:hypothetical protein